GFRRFLLPLRLGALAGKHRWPFFQKLFLPGAHLVRMHVVLAGDFVDGSQPASRFQRDFELESSVMLAAFSRQLQFLHKLSDYSPIHLSLWSSFWGQSYYSPSDQARVGER